MSKNLKAVTNPKVDEFFARPGKWRQALTVLRRIALHCQLTEELKWGKPCYMFQNNNVLILQGFKQSCALLFTKGALLSDSANILEKPGENTQAARRVSFITLQQVVDLESTLAAYIQEAIEIEKSGLKVEFKKADEFPMPEELLHKLNTNNELKKAFTALTPGRQRAYLLHFSAAKQSKTRVSRIEKYIPAILDGKGIND